VPRWQDDPEKVKAAVEKAQATRRELGPRYPVDRSPIRLAPEFAGSHGRFAKPGITTKQHPSRDSPA
jgi:hypothetical protein